MSSENGLLLDVQKKWKEIGRSNNDLSELKLDVDLYKKLLNLFQVGEFYYFVFSPYLGEIEYTSPLLTEVLGYDCQNFNIDRMLSLIHPEDIATFINFENKVVEFKKGLTPEQILKYKTLYNYRIRKANGDYLHILQQSITIQCDENGAVLRNFVTHTDISDFKKDTSKNLSFVGIDGEPTYRNVIVGEELIASKKLFTKREHEILCLLSQNLSTKEIAEILNISHYTVSTHRKNIHEKCGTKTTLELVTKAVENNWI